MLDIKNLSASVDDTPILKGLSLSLKPGKIHAIMGPNGSGKSTLGKVIAGDPVYQVTGGELNYTVNYKQKSLLDLSASERAGLGIFLSFQYPPEIAGVPNEEFLRASFGAICRAQGVTEMSFEAFREFLHGKIAELGIDESFLARELNVDFSGGEKKRNELLQLAVLSPRLAILDEMDSGLDVDALRTLSDFLVRYHRAESDRCLVLITHYQRLLEYLCPDYVHVISEGKVVRSGDGTLALDIERHGYGGVLGSAAELS